MFRNRTLAIALLVTAATLSAAPLEAGTNDSYLYGLNWYDWQTGNYGHLGQFPVTFRNDGTADWGTLPQAWNDVLSRNLTPYISYRLFTGRSAVGAGWPNERCVRPGAGHRRRTGQRFARPGIDLRRAGFRSPGRQRRREPEQSARSSQRCL